MGFYVDLEMPKDCRMCPFANYDMFNTFCGCDITRGKRWAVKNDKDYAKSSTRPDWCPLIEVPEPHGRCIDADALNYSMLYKENWMRGTGIEAPAVWRKDIDAAPTIIPASGENE